MLNSSTSSVAFISICEQRLKLLGETSFIIAFCCSCQSSQDFDTLSKSKCLWNHQPKSMRMHLIRIFVFKLLHELIDITFMRYLPCYHSRILRASAKVIQEKYPRTDNLWETKRNSRNWTPPPQRHVNVTTSRYSSPHPPPHKHTPKWKRDL